MTHFLLSSPRDQKFGWRYLGNKEGFWWWAGVKTTRFFKAFDIVKKGDFCILEFRISGSGGHISGTRRATEDPMVAKLPDFWELFKYYLQTHLNFWIMDLRNSRFLDFWIGQRYLRKELPEICCMYIGGWAPEGRRMKSRSPKGLQLHKAPRIL